tara:strand:+ start:604 stop:882 length:279 start_codon:yes stop_codon:yes gene_type:complete
MGGVSSLKKWAKEGLEAERSRVSQMIIDVERAETLKQLEEVIARHRKEAAEKPLGDYSVGDLLDKYMKAIDKKREVLKMKERLGNGVPPLKL